LNPPQGYWNCGRRDGGSVTGHSRAAAACGGNFELDDIFSGSP
jgi:hypothetical protein